MCIYTMHLTLDLEGQDDILFACFIVRMSMSKSILGCLKIRYMTQSLENININININIKYKYKIYKLFMPENSFISR